MLSNNIRGAGGLAISWYSNRNLWQGEVYRNKRDKDGYLSVTIRIDNSPKDKVIRAKQILITIPSTLENLAPF